MAGWLFFVGMLVAIALGAGSNLFATKRFKERWKRLLVILAGFVLNVVFLLVSYRVALEFAHLSAYGLGEALALGIGLALGYLIYVGLGSVLFLLSTVAASFGKRIVRARKRRKALKTGSGSQGS